MSEQAADSGIDRRKQWCAVISAMFSIIAAGSYTTLAGLLTTKFASELGWSASAISVGVGVNMVFYGITAPFAIFAMQKYGIRRVSMLGLAVLIGGGLLCLIPNTIVFNIAWGLLVGLGVGSLTMAFGALVARTWFGANQGAVAGVLTASAVFGQFALLPLWAEAADAFGWQAPLIGCTAVAVLAMVVNAFFMSDESKIATKSQEAVAAANKGFVSILHVLMAAIRSKPFWVLVALFVICGATTNGVMWSHFTPYAVACGMSATSASSVLFLIGLFNIAGTVASGWLTDRISSRLILAFVFFARAGTLLWLPLIITSDFNAGIVTFGILFGILDVATVPPVIALCNRVFDDDGPAVFGWVNAFHQVGAGVMAFSGGLIKSGYGSYLPMWITAGVLCAAAAFIVYTSSYHARRSAGSYSAAASGSPAS